MAMNATPKWIDVDGIRTRYFEAGTGAPILLITGGNFGAGDAASIVESWDRNFMPLAQRHRVFAVDKLGQGYTDNPPNDDYTMSAVVRHLGGFIKAVDIQGVHVAGQSRGAMAAACVTLDFPELVRSCTLVNTSTLAPGVGLNEVILGGSPYPHFTREGQQWLFERCEYDKTIVDDEFLDEAMKVFALPKYVESVRKMEQEGLKALLFAPQLARLKKETLQRLAQQGMGRPTQIIWGIEDHTATLDRGIDLFHIISARERQTTMHVMNAAGHHPYREHPEHFNEIMFGFLKSMQP
jgi:2-hydroxy-6-oxonona-2,4-dienedioate hydrolase